MSWTNYLKLVFLSIVVNICESKRKCFFIEKPSLQLAVDHLNPIPDKVYSYENCKNLCCDTKFCLGVNYIHQKLVKNFINFILCYIMYTIPLYEVIVYTSAIKSVINFSIDSLEIFP